MTTDERVKLVLGMMLDNCNIDASVYLDDVLEEEGLDCYAIDSETYEDTIEKIQAKLCNFYAQL